MGYSKSIRAFNRVKKYLDEMVEKQEVLSWPAEDSAKLAYYIREGIKVAKLRAADNEYPNREQFKPYISLSAKFVVRDKGKQVVAEPRELVPTISASEALKKIVLEDVIEPLEVVGAVIKHKSDIMFFPEADLDSNSLEKIYGWTSRHDYFIVVSDVGITLTRTDPGEIAWHPNQSAASS